MRFRMREELLISDLVGRRLQALFRLFPLVLALCQAPMCAVGVLALITPQWFLRRKGGCVGSGLALDLSGLLRPDSAFPLSPGSLVEGPAKDFFLFFRTLPGPWCCGAVVGLLGR